MSCRVLKRDMEVAMLDAVVERCLAAGIKRIVGTYLPTPKNGMVADFYLKLGFEADLIENSELPGGATVWKLDAAGHQPKNRHIRVREHVNA
jgi:predicted enzyme involved in methoxymalonyl-ACP biosynthesis